MDAMQRFKSKIKEVDGHWIWTGAATGSRSRRPVFYPGGDLGAKQVYAHRWIYEQVVGPIPEGYEVDHTCKQGMCVRPGCLEAVTPEENNRRNRLKVCRAGLHDLTDPENVNWDGKGRRRGCLPCKRKTSLDHYYAKGRDRRASHR